jgi:hypothetical protein
MPLNGRQMGGPLAARFVSRHQISLTSPSGRSIVKAAKQDEFVVAPVAYPNEVAASASTLSRAGDGKRTAPTTSARATGF